MTMGTPIFKLLFFLKKNQLGPKRLIKSELGSVKLLLVMI